MDQCTHCTVRGDEKACRETKCNLHESWMVESLRAQLAEVARENESLKRDFNRETVGQIIAALHADVDRKTDQLLATQAHAARLVEALRLVVKCCDEPRSRDNSEHDGLDALEAARSALSTPINLDALHEALARECERLATICKAKSDELYNRNSRMQHHTGAGTGCDLCADICKKEAAAHRSKKNGA